MTKKDMAFPTCFKRLVKNTTYVRLFKKNAAKEKFLFTLTDY